MTFQTLATSIAAGTPQDGSSLANSRHSTAHNYMHSVFNTVFVGGKPGGVDPFPAHAAQVMELNQWDGGAPISALGSTFKVTRYEAMPPGTVFDPQYNAAIYGLVASAPNNHGQATAVCGAINGYAEGGAYVVAGFFTAIQGSGANVGGLYGGALGAYITALSIVDHSAIQGISMGGTNGTKLDGDPANGAQAGIDMACGATGEYTASVSFTNATPTVVTWTGHGLLSGNVVQFTASGSMPTGVTANTNYWITVTDANHFKISTTLRNQVTSTYVAASSTGSGVTGAFFGYFGNGYQMRIAGGNVDTIFNVLDSGPNAYYKRGISLALANFDDGTGFPWWIELDSAWGFTRNSNNPIYNVDAGDFLAYIRSTNTLAMFFGSTSTFEVTPTALTHRGLPAADPGAGSKQLYYKPGDLNRVYYSP